MTSITLHGEIAEQVGRESWNLKVNSIKEALRAIQVLSKGKLLKYLIGAAEKSVEYKVLVNKREIMNPENISLEKPESILNSELVMINEKLETLDIVPIIKGAGGGGGNSTTKGVLALVLGVILIASGIGAAGGVTFLGMAGAAGGTGATVLSGALIGAGIGLAVTGVTLLMMSPPKFEDFRKIQQDGSKPSYLFDGPSNVIGEGGPVPIGYGRMKIGSQTVEVSVNNVEMDTKSTAADVKDSINYI
jgi:predicted phage tail protein